MPVRPPTESTNLELRDYFRVIQRRKVLIGLITLVALGLAMVFTKFQTPVYEGRAQVLVAASQADLIMGTGSATNPTVNETEIATEVQVMRSRGMRNAITRRLKYDPDVTIGAPDKTSPTITVASRNEDPKQAALDANEFAKAFVIERRAAINNQFEDAITDVQRQMTDLDREVADARLRIGELDGEIERTTDNSQLLILTAERDRLIQTSDAARIAQRQAELQASVDRLQNAQNSNLARGQYTVSEGFVPSNPVYPEPIKNGITALGIGLLLGILVAFVLDYFDDTFRTKDDLDAATGGIPVLSIVPSVIGWRDRSEALLETVTHPNSPASEAYRSLRTNLEFVSIENDIRLVHVTSSAPGEGKSTTSANLAVSLARAGKRVVLVDCDLRRPRLHAFFDMENKVGFTTVLLGAVGIQDVLQPAPGVPGLLILPSGPPPPNPSELLATDLARSKLDALAKSADYVIMDSPPLLPVADSVILSGYAHATLLVVTARSTSKRSLIRSLELLAQVDAPLEGLIFNGASPEATYGYGYRYGYATYGAYAPHSAYADSKRHAPILGRHHDHPDQHETINGHDPAVEALLPTKGPSARSRGL